MNYKKALSLAGDDKTNLYEICAKFHTSELILKYLKASLLMTPKPQGFTDRVLKRSALSEKDKEFVRLQSKLEGTYS